MVAGAIAHGPSLRRVLAELRATIQRLLPSARARDYGRQCTAITQRTWDRALRRIRWSGTAPMRLGGWPNKIPRFGCTVGGYGGSTGKLAASSGGRPPCSRGRLYPARIHGLLRNKEGWFDRPLPGPRNTTLFLTHHLQGRVFHIRALSSIIFATRNATRHLWCVV